MEENLLINLKILSLLEKNDKISIANELIVIDHNGIFQSIKRWWYDTNRFIGIEFIENFRTHFKKLSPEDIAYPRSCNNLKKYSSSKDIYQKSTPIHVTEKSGEKNLALISPSFPLSSMASRPWLITSTS